MTQKYVIVNADDFGASTGVNRGILEAHLRGVVTSASLMVTGRAVHEAVAMSRDHPALAIGLHWDVWGEDERSFDMTHAAAVRDEVHRQLSRFQDLLGTMPTHIDSHKHAHRRAMPIFLELGEQLGVPVRGDGRVAYLTGFYGQWEWGVTDLTHVGVPFLCEMIRTQLDRQFSEIGCHPGYVSADYQAVYLRERETEVATLTDPQVRRTLDDEGVRLISFADCRTLATAVVADARRAGREADG